MQFICMQFKILCDGLISFKLLKAIHFQCKHLVAMNIAIALECYAVREISDQEYVAYVAYETESPIKKESK